MVLTSPLVEYWNLHCRELYRRYDGKTVVLSHDGPDIWVQTGSKKLEDVLNTVKVIPFDSFTAAANYVAGLDPKQAEKSLCVPVPNKTDRMDRYVDRYVGVRGVRLV